MYDLRIKWRNMYLEKLRKDLEVLDSYAFLLYSSKI